MNIICPGALLLLISFMYVLKAFLLTSKFRTIPWAQPLGDFPVCCAGSASALGGFADSTAPSTPGAFAGPTTLSVPVVFEGNIL